MLLLRPGDALLALLVRPTALALAAANHVAGALKASVAGAGIPVEREPSGLRRATAAAAVAGEGHESGLDEADIALEVIVVGDDVGHRPPRQQLGDPLPPIRRVGVDPRQRALEHLVLLHRPRPGPGPPVRRRRQEPPAARRLSREVGRRQHLHPQLRHPRTNRPPRFLSPSLSLSESEDTDTEEGGETLVSQSARREGGRGEVGTGGERGVFMVKGSGGGGRGRCQSGQR